MKEIGVVIPDRWGLGKFLHQDLEKIIRLLFYKLVIDFLKSLLRTYIVFVGLDVDAD